MQDVKTPISDSWKDAFIESLKDPQEAAVYLEVVLEEENPEPKLLIAAIEDIMRAFSSQHLLSEELIKKQEKIYDCLTVSGCTAIYTFVELL
ncbi:MAG TPA: transcriptional regulator, partial [Planktothrix sp. UBA8402]|nr:transcriptional regulator [Planktothrix sp. UBA8402]